MDPVAFIESALRLLRAWTTLLGVLPPGDLAARASRETLALAQHVQRWRESGFLGQIDRGHLDVLRRSAAQYSEVYAATPADLLRGRVPSPGEAAPTSDWIDRGIESARVGTGVLLLTLVAGALLLLRGGRT